MQGLVLHFYSPLLLEPRLGFEIGPKALRLLQLLGQGLLHPRRQSGRAIGMSLERQQLLQTGPGIRVHPATDRLPMDGQQRSDSLARYSLLALEEVEHLEAGLAPGSRLCVQPGFERREAFLNWR